MQLVAQSDTDTGTDDGTGTDIAEFVLDDPPCYRGEGTFCRWVYDQTGQNETVANVANWFVDRPLQVVIVLLIAWVVVRIAKRWVARVVGRVINPGESATAQLGRLGVPLPDALTAVRDPRRQARASSISAVLTSSIVIVVWTIAFITILGVVGIELGPLIAGAGIAGIALGFGAQSLVKDCIAGLFMLLEDQYGIGDIVDLGEATGAVEGVSLRTTVLRGVDGTVWHVPNGVVQRVGNKSQLWSVALLDIDVAYDTDLERARDLLERAAREVCDTEEFRELVIDPPQVLGVEVLGADGITLRLTVKVQPGTQYPIQRAIRAQVKRVFDDAAVEIPFPQRTIWMRTEPGAPAAPVDPSAEQPDSASNDGTVE